MVQCAYQAHEGNRRAGQVPGAVSFLGRDRLHFYLGMRASIVSHSRDRILFTMSVAIARRSKGIPDGKTGAHISLAYGKVSQLRCLSSCRSILVYISPHHYSLSHVKSFVEASSDDFNLFASSDVDAMLPRAVSSRRRGCDPPLRFSRATGRNLIRNLLES